jgi:mono/diheme cytochrome c family protein
MTPPNPKFIAAQAGFYWAAAAFVPQIALAADFTQVAREQAAKYFYARPPMTSGAKITLPVPEPALLAASAPRVNQGLYLARAGDCIGCHTRPGGMPFAGGLALATPFGSIVSTNITPDKEDGIGNYTEAQFVRLMRQGVTETNHNIYPAMPYASYSRLSDDDLGALYAYFMQGVAPVKQVNTQTNLPWPLSVRWLVKAWNWLYLPSKPYVAQAAKSAEWNRGAYLVQGLGHCGACHTPRSALGGEKAITEKGSETFLAGAVIDGWYAQPLRAIQGSQAGLGNWSAQSIVQYLKTGRNNHTAAFGSMAEVVGNSTQHLNDTDLMAIAVYLKTVGDAGSASDAAPAKSPLAQVTSPAVPAAPNAPSLTHAALRTGQTTTPGALVYLNNCAGCHQSSGKGSGSTFPALAQSSTVAALDATSLIRIVLQGSNMPSTQTAPSALAMPGLEWRLSDANVADVLTFIRSSWGNQAEAVTPQSVAKIRVEIQK